MQAEIKKFLARRKGVGRDSIAARVNRYGIRRTRSANATRRCRLKRTSPTTCGWARHKISRSIRDKLHYDWHWDWNTGSGEMGNWGVHVLDDLRNNVFHDSVALPKRILGGGGRVALE